MFSLFFSYKIFFASKRNKNDILIRLMLFISINNFFGSYTASQKVLTKFESLIKYLVHSGQVGKILSQQFSRRKLIREIKKSHRNVVQSQLTLLMSLLERYVVKIILFLASILFDANLACESNYIILVIFYEQVENNFMNCFISRTTYYFKFWLFLYTCYAAFCNDFYLCEERVLHKNDFAHR